MLSRLLSLERRRSKLARLAPAGPLRDFLSTPFPNRERDCREVDYVALDLETTGLNAQADAIVSVGMVSLHGVRIDLATARHCIVRVDQGIPEKSVIIHRLTHDTVAQGQSLELVLGEILAHLAGKAMIAHHAHVEFSFLRAACAKVFHGDFLVPIVDTQHLARRWLERRDKPYTSSELRLFNLRARYNLPRYPAHNALSDALAAGELFAAQVAERDCNQRLPLKDFLVRL